MAEFALLIDGVFQKIEHYADRPPNIEHKKVGWYPVIREFGEPFVGLDGDNYFIRKVDPATLPPPVPAVISDRQFFQQLAVMGLVTEQAAEEAVAAGVLPPSLLELIEMLPEQARFPARMLLKGATQFYRAHEMTDTIAWLYGWDAATVDDLFRSAAAL